MTITESLKRFRGNSKLTQKAVADILGMSQQSYYYYESKGDPPSAAIVKLALKYNVSTDYLLGLSDQPHPVSPTAAVSSAPPENDKVVEAAIALVKALREQVEQDRREAAGDKEARIDKHDGDTNEA